FSQIQPLIRTRSPCWHRLLTLRGTRSRNRAALLQQIIRLHGHVKCSPNGLLRWARRASAIRSALWMTHSLIWQVQNSVLLPWTDHSCRRISRVKRRHVAFWALSGHADRPAKCRLLGEGADVVLYEYMR